MDRQPLIDHIRIHSSPLDPVPTGEAVRVNARPGIRAVVFDVYGTLFISGSGDISLAQGEDRSGSLIAALETAGFVVQDPEQRRDDLRVVRDPQASWSELFMATLEAFREQRKADGIRYPEVRIEEVWKQFTEDAAAAGRLSGDGHVNLAIVDYECRVNPCWPMPGLTDVLAKIAESGLQMGIVSNAQFYTPLLFPALIDRDLPACGFNPDLCVWSYVQREGKPSKGLYLYLRDKLEAVRITAGEVLYIGNDLRNDVWPAAAAGFQTCLFAGDQRSLRWRADDPDCRDILPDFVITDLSQLAAILG
jgi:putative hydrolase of the HAD superfamily